MKFISLEGVLKFIKSDELWDPDGDIDKKNHLMRVLTTQWNIRPVNVSTEISSGKTIIKGQINKRIEGEIFLLDGNSNPIIQTYSTTYSDEAGKINFETKLDGVIQDRSNMYLYFKTKDTSNSIISFWVNIQPGAETNHDNREKTMFENLYKKAERVLETGEHHDTVFSDIHFDEEMDESPKTEEHQSNPEKTNQPTESSPEESTTEEPSERSKRSTSLTEQEENPVDTQTQAQQVNPTQPQKQDIPSELLEEPKTAAPKNPVELLNPITSEENTTADTTPSFTLNAPKDAPDAVKALVTLDNRPEYELELIDNQGVFTVEMPLAEGPHELKVKFIDPDGDWIRLDKTFTIDVSSERILSSLETPDRYQIDLSTGSKTSPSKENADILMMTPVLHLPEHEEESIYYG